MKILLLAISCVILYGADMFLTYQLLGKNTEDYEEENILLAKLFNKFGISKTVIAAFLLFCIFVMAVVFLLPDMDIILLVLLAVGIINLLNNLNTIARVKNRRHMQESE
ncbi:hypothetical protein [Deinococcus sp.]|uniref:hypothetical protein n=1 Tax=Deinococcus sp. TaxID=47478 RepID=UPI0025C45DAF|nr:hypothetical protein [Deinococcus sp.]